MDRTGDPIVMNTVFDATHIILSLKLGDHEGLALFIHGRLPKRTLLILLPVILMHHRYLHGLSEDDANSFGYLLKVSSIYKKILLNSALPDQPCTRQASKQKNTMQQSFCNS